MLSEALEDFKAQRYRWRVAFMRDGSRVAARSPSSQLQMASPDRSPCVSPEPPYRSARFLEQRFAAVLSFALWHGA